MKLVGKNILHISPEPWSHLFVSKHHYARHLAQRGNNVWFLNPPGNEAKVSPTDISSLQVLDYRGFPPLMRYYPAFLRRWFTFRSFRHLEKMAGISFDIIWSFDNSVFFQLDSIPKSVLKISHIVDLNQDFETRRAATTADVCFCTTQAIKAKLEKYAFGKVHWINHGLSINVSQTVQKQVVLPGKNSIKAVYAGNLAMQYLDWEILFNAASINPKIDFVFFGSNADEFDLGVNWMHSWKQMMIELPNVYWPGRVASDQLQSIYQSADLLLIAYQESHHIDQANPHKTLEYLYSGKPIVATYTAAYADMNLIYMSERNEDWPALLEKVINNLDQLAADVLVESRRSYALDNTYEMQIQRIETILSTL